MKKNAVKGSRRFLTTIASAIVSWIFAVPAAIATPITFMFSGPATGTLGATAFTGAQVTVIGTADTANVVLAAPSVPCVVLQSVTINISGVGSATATAPTQNVAFDNQTNSIWGFANGTCSLAIDWLAASDPQAATYGLVTSIGPATGTQLAVGGISTTAGTLTFTAAPLTFQATLGQATISLSSIDQSDLWWIPAESGWGMQLVERGDVIFATLFVYDQSMNPTWYVATMNFVSGQTWAGNLYATTGPWFGTVPFNPALVTATLVGTMTWTAGFLDVGTVAYTVNGVPVSKNVIRQTLVAQNYSGHFFGVIHQTASGCTNSAFNGTTDTPTVLNITQSGSAITITSLPAVGGSCTFTGMLQQNGQMGLVQGSYSCSAGFSGQFDIVEFQVNEVSVSGVFDAGATNPAGCNFSGWIGGLAVTTF